MVSKIRFKNFKLFKEWQELEIKPITILIGKNNTGKTAVLKLSVLVNYLLNGGAVNTIHKIKLGHENNLLECGTGFNDLVYNRSNLGIFELEISNNVQTINAVISKDGLLELNDNGTNINIENTTFSGLSYSSTATNNLKHEVDYIGGIRVEPEYNYPINSEILKKIGIKGQNTYPILVQDFKKTKQLLNKISEWYKNNFEGWEVGVIENKLLTETNYSVVISANKIDAINIKQSGQGIHQALPLIARSFMVEQSSILIVIEEPETHLHPAAHGNLAQRFVESYLDDNNKRYLIETHSQNFILRIRRLVAEGKLSPNDLKIYYVDYDEDLNYSNLKEINVDSDGGISWWPDGVFGESVLEARAIMNANINDLRNVD
jgi:predicted ATPase